MRPTEQNAAMKPLHLVENMEKQYYHQISPVGVEAFNNAHDEDTILKARIRRLRLISRFAATLLSLAVLASISITVHKFLTTQNIYHEAPLPDGPGSAPRTAWAKDTKVWPTYMYFIVAAVSFVLNLAVLVGYLIGGAKKANKAATVASTFSWIVMLGNLVVWSVAAALYRKEKEPDKNGKTRDIWGWACSPAAREIQKEFAAEVDYNRSCDVQSVSWYIGLAQVAAAMLTVVIYILVLMRRGSKKNLKKRYSQMAGQYPSNY